MKKYSRIIGYLRQKKGQLALYLLCVLLATAFGVVSIGMLIPFFNLIFDSGSAVGVDFLKGMPFGRPIAGFLVDYIKQDRLAALTAICLFIIVATILKNLFIYLSNRISVPIRVSIITELRLAILPKRRRVILFPV
jgi:subfamily B ATP-binding cassette protein MsbA